MGSFLTVVVYRVPRQESIVWPGSRCPHCGHRLRWYENIPMVSFILQRGVCRFCGAPISWRYPAVELMAMIWSMLVAHTFAFPVVVGWMVVGWIWIALAWIDAEHGILPDSILNVHLFLLLGMILMGFFSFRMVMVGMLLGIGLVGGLRYGWFLISGQEGLGGGDVKLLALLGGWMGPGGVLWTLGGGAILALLIMVFVPAARRKVVYFGPYLLACAAAYPWLGRWVVDIFMRSVYI